MIASVRATHYFRRVRGGSQPHLMLGSDDNLWVVKFQNNPQHIRVLANEMIATILAEKIGLSVATAGIVDVSLPLITQTAELRVDAESGRKVQCTPGLQYGSKYVGGVRPGLVVDYLPEEQLKEVRNLSEFAGILALDKWTGNIDGRQAVYTRRNRRRVYDVTFIDHGYCFHAGDWIFEDAPLRGAYPQNIVYANVTGWESFEPWLSRMETLDPAVIMAITDSIPKEWYGGSKSDVYRLLERLVKRRERIRELIVDFANCNRYPFPLWRKRRGASSLRGWQPNH